MDHRHLHPGESVVCQPRRYQCFSNIVMLLLLYHESLKLRHCVLNGPLWFSEDHSICIGDIRKVAEVRFANVCINYRIDVCTKFTKNHVFRNLAACSTSLILCWKATKIDDWKYVRGEKNEKKNSSQFLFTARCKMLNWKFTMDVGQYKRCI